MRPTLVVLSLLLVSACGKHVDPTLVMDQAMPTLVDRPATSELTLVYATNGMDCRITKTVDTADIARIFQWYCDQGPCTFKRTAGHPYPEFVFDMTSIPVDPAFGNVGSCGWDIASLMGVL